MLGIARGTEPLRPDDRSAVVQGSAVVSAQNAVIAAGGWATTCQGPSGVSAAGSAYLVAPTHTVPALQVVVEEYAAHGLDCFAKLHGQFCLVLYDPAQARLILAVDRFCTRVLYHCQRDGALLFSTRLAALHAAQGSRVDPQAVLEYLLYTSIPTPRTAFIGVHKVPPGHLLISDRSGIRLQPYWDITYPERNGGFSEHDCARELRREIEDAVRRYVTAENGDRRIGAFLSGGTDSSTVTGMMARITNEKVKTFSIGYAEHGHDERSYARTAAEWFGAEAYELSLAPAPALASIPRIARYYEEPFGNASALATYACATLAREHGVDVLYAGDGGDELFAGNERYRVDKVFSLYQHVPRVIRRALTDPLSQTFPEQLPLFGPARRYIRRSNIPNPRRMFSYNLLLSEPLPRFLASSFLDSVDPTQLLGAAESHFQRPAQGTSELNRLLYLDLKLAIADNDVRKVSGMTELAGIAVRYPLLDTQLAEFSGTVPTKLKLRGMEKRYIFKRALAEFLPPAILAKPKHGFGVPVAHWMKTDNGWRNFASDLLQDRRTRERGYFQPAALADLQQQVAGDQTAFYGDTLWTILMLELWHREHAGG